MQLSFSSLKQLTVPIVAAALIACQPASEANLGNSQETEFNTAYLEQMGFVVESHQAAPMDGLIEVITNQGLVYTNADGSQLISGRIYDITAAEPVNLSDLSLNAMRQRDVAAWADSTIEYAAPDVKHVVYVFTDPSCGYCRQLHERLEDYLALGISVRYLAWPRTGLTGSAAKLLEQAWCADDQRQALTAIKQDQALPAANCEAPIADHYALGHKFGVRGTPAFVLPSGQLVPGLLPPQQLLAELER